MPRRTQTAKSCLTRIHVNQHVIRHNAKTGERNPVLTVKSRGRNRYAHAVSILGPSTVVYAPDTPLSCGARVWVETTSPVVLDPEQDSVATTETEDSMVDRNVKNVIHWFDV
jgi:hypothetical protein